MTWAKLDDGITDMPAMLALPRGVRLMHLEGIVWACRHETDGQIPRHVLGKPTDEPDAIEAAGTLVDAGLWLTLGDGWEVAGFLDHQRSADDISRSRELTNERQRRRRQHLTGDHSLCEPRYCHAASRVTDGVTNGVSHGSPSRPVPTRPKGGGGQGAGGPSGSAGATPAGPPPTVGQSLTIVGGDR